MTGEVVYLTGPAPDASPVPMTFPEKTNLRNAAHWAKQVYPGPVGDLISQELLSWEDLGYRFGGDSSVARLVDHVLKQPRPQAAGDQERAAGEAAA